MLKPTAKNMHTGYAVLLWLFLFVSSAAFSQLNADFSVSKSGGCSPLTVYFTNTTTGASSGASFSWDFGNGQTSTNRTDAGTQYKEARSYTVTLTVKDGNQISTKQQTITAYKKPTVDFSASVPGGCIPISVTFSSNVSPGDGNIANYFWDFGDGVTQEGANLSQPSHTYDFPQKASVSLTVFNSFGCFTSLEKSEIVHANKGVKADFEADKSGLCKESDPVTFKNKSAGSGNFSYLWDFGDGNTSTQKEPTHVYNRKGNFTVKLTVNSDEGCTSTTVKTDYMHVATGFDVDFEGPQVTCTGKKVAFVNKSGTVPQSVLWKTDEGVTSNKSDTAYLSFSTPGIHKVTLTNTYGACEASATKDIEVTLKPDLKGFEMITAGDCGTPQTVNFRDTTTGAVKWEWDFKSGVATIDATEQAPSYRYYEDGDFVITLVVANAAGCSDTVQKTLSLKTPQVSIKYTKSTSTTGNTSCEPFTMDFAVNTSEPLKEYNWDFGNGTTSTSATPQVTFSQKGDYTVKLKYTTQKGCTGETTYAVSYYEKPKILDISVSQANVCGNTPVTFTANAVGSITEYRWNFGEPDPANPLTNPATHKYTREGTFSVTLVATNGSCEDVMVKNNIVTVTPPFPKISTVTNTCNGTRGEVTFTQTASQSTRWDWDFGDGATLSLTSNTFEVKHTYSNSGVYTVKLTTNYGQCTVADSVKAYVLLKQSPNFTANRVQLCTSDSLKVKIDNLDSNPYNGTQHYAIEKFEFQDGTVFTGLFAYDAANSTQTVHNGLLTGLTDHGNLRVLLRTQNFNCADTSNYVLLDVRGPVPAMEVVGNTTNCYKTPFVFKDLSKGANNIPLTLWEWDYGDGKKEILQTGNEVKHAYEDPGSYNVRLKVTDGEGCSAITPLGAHIVQASGPKAVALPADTAILPNATVDFYNYSNTYNSDNAKYKWQFSDGSTSTDLNVSKKYPNTGTYVEKLIASDATTSCTDTAYITVRVLKVNVSFTMELSYINNANCPPLLAKFTNTSENVDSVNWDFGDGSLAGNQNFPRHTYEKPGVYTVTLKGFTNGLSDSITKEFKVGGPYATLTADVLGGCRKQTVTLKADIVDATSYVWDMGDGTLKQTPATTITYDYNDPGVYRPSLIMNDNSGCSSVFELADSIVIDTLNVSLANAANRFCDSALVEFVPQIQSIADDLEGIDLKYHWDFGTGQPQDVADTRNASFQYKKAGQYLVKLKVESPFGCEQEVSLPVTVMESPIAGISGPSAVCQGATAQFNGTVSNNTGAVEWLWKFSNGSTSNEQNPTVLVTDPPVLDVTLIVKNNECTDTATTQVSVIIKPAVRATAAKTTICLGESVQLNAEGSATTYSWSPATGLSSTTIASPTATPTTTTTYTVRITDAIGCPNADSVKITVIQPFEMNVVSEAVVCEGRSVQMAASGAAYYEWSGDDAQEISNPNIPNPVVTPKTSTTYKVVGYDAHRCFKDEEQVKVTVNPAPKFSAGPDAEVLALDNYQLQTTGSSDITQWSWSPADYLSCTDCASPVTRPITPISYVAKVRNQAGCEATDTVNIKLLCTGGFVFIPNSFTPNNDGKNDRFYIRGRGVSNVLSLSIYNRWGEVVFQKTNFLIEDRASGWNGQYKGQLVPAGSYIYIAKMQCDAGEPFIQKGTITVVY